MAYGKKTGGRAKGVKNKKTLERIKFAQEMADQGISPLQVMLTAMRQAWDAGKIDEAVAVADKAAPYVHARLAATQMTVDDKRSVEQYSDAELEALLATSGERAVAEEEGAPLTH